MFVYRVAFFMLKPGVILLMLGLLLTLPLSFGSFSLGPVTLSLYWQLFGVTFTILGLQSLFFGCIAQIICDYTGRSRRRWMAIFRYTRTVLVSLAAFLLGIGLTGALAVRYFSTGYTLPTASSMLDHLAVTGVLFVIAGFSLFCFTLLLHATGVHVGAFDPSKDDPDVTT
jgi:hypothetical protein